jgi:membrane-associated protease RseP (regulator of RpoE activity)
MRFWLWLTAIGWFSLPAAALAQSPLEELERRLESGSTTPREPGYLGLMADENGGRGLRVVGVRADSPAEAAGIREGDVLVELERRPLRSLDDLGNIMRFRGPGDSLGVTFERDGKRHVVTARLVARPAPLNASEAANAAERPAEAAPSPKTLQTDESLPPPIESVVPPDTHVAARDESAAPPVESVVPFPRRPVAAAPPQVETESSDSLELLRRELAEALRRLDRIEQRLTVLEKRLNAVPAERR